MSVQVLTGYDAAFTTLNATASAPIFIFGVNDKPMIALPSSGFSAFGNAANVLGPGIAVSDVDAGAMDLEVWLHAFRIQLGDVCLVQLTLSVVQGTLAIGGEGVVIVSTIQVSQGAAQLTLRGNAANLSLALSQNLTYTPFMDFYGVDSLTVSVSDLGHSSSVAGGAALLSTNSTSIVVHRPLLVELTVPEANTSLALSTSSQWNPSLLDLSVGEVAKVVVSVYLPARPSSVNVSLAIEGTVLEFQSPLEVVAVGSNVLSPTTAAVDGGVAVFTSSHVEVVLGSVAVGAQLADSNANVVRFAVPVVVANNSASYSSVGAQWVNVTTTHRCVYWFHGHAA